MRLHVTWLVERMNWLLVKYVTSQKISGFSMLSSCAILRSPRRWLSIAIPVMAWKLCFCLVLKVFSIRTSVWVHTCFVYSRLVETVDGWNRNTTPIVDNIYIFFLPLHVVTIGIYCYKYQFKLTAAASLCEGWWNKLCTAILGKKFS